MIFALRRLPTTVSRLAWITFRLLRGRSLILSLTVSRLAEQNDLLVPSEFMRTRAESD